MVRARCGELDVLRDGGLDRHRHDGHRGAVSNGRNGDVEDGDGEVAAAVHPAGQRPGREVESGALARNGFALPMQPGS